MIHDEIKEWKTAFEKQFGRYPTSEEVAFKRIECITRAVDKLEIILRNQAFINEKLDKILHKLQ